MSLGQPSRALCAGPDLQRRRLLGVAFGLVLAPAASLSCSSHQDVVGRLRGEALPAPTDSARPDAGTAQTGADAGQGLEVWVRALLAPPDAPGPEPWPLDEPIAPFVPPAPEPDSTNEYPPPEPDFTWDAGASGSGGHDDPDDPDWSEPFPRPEEGPDDDEPRFDRPFELRLRYFGQDAERLIAWSGPLSSMRESEPTLVIDVSSVRYWVTLRLGFQGP